MDKTRSPSSTSSDAVVTTGIKDVSVMEKTNPASKRTRKKSKRITKRFLWQEDLHLRFVAAIFDLGLKNASPEALLPLMNKPDPASGLTTEYLKSHLQKYRINYERSRQEFQELCDQEVKRDRKRRRRQEEHRSSATEAFVFPVRERCDSFIANIATESDATSSSGITGEEGLSMGPYVCTRELADAAASIAASRYPAEFYPPQQAPVIAPVSSGMPELTDAQWRIFSMLMSAPPLGVDGLSIHVPHETPLGQAQVQEELQQMHQAMQAQMNFHRQMLTRKVELSGGLYQSSGMKNWNSSQYGDFYRASVQTSQPSPFEQTWTRTQQIHQRQLASHRLQQQQLNQFEGNPPQQYLPVPEAPSANSQAVPSDSLPTLVERSHEDPADAKSDAIGEDIHRWDPFNIGLEDDELFDFLKS